MERHLLEAATSTKDAIEAVARLCQDEYRQWLKHSLNEHLHGTETFAPARSEMTAQGLFVFKHDSKLGSAHAHDLFERIQVNKKADVAVPRDFSDYQVSIDDQDLPAGIELIRRVG